VRTFVIGISVLCSCQHNSDVRFGIHLRSLSDGGHHPAAQCPTMYYSRGRTRIDDIYLGSVTSSRLTVIVEVPDGNHLVIFDWKSAQVLFVGQISHNFANRAQAFTQEIEFGRSVLAEFIDDYRLLIRVRQTVDAQPSLVLMDTGKNTGGSPMQTVFHLPRSIGGLYFTLEWGAHKPSREESLAPFHHDPAQGIVVLELERDSRRLVVRVGALLKLLRDREGTEIEWDEWKHYVVLTSIDLEHLMIHAVRVSGCRLFFIYCTGSGSDFQMEAYDFSMQGRAKHLNGQTCGEFGVKCLPSTGPRVKIPRDQFARHSHSAYMVLLYVSITVSPPLLE
jgi:hypothetical protein